MVAVSHAHARSAHGSDRCRHPPRGRPAALPPADGPGRRYLLFLGRMSPDKGVHVAVRVAARAGLPLVIATKMRHPDEMAYYEREVGTAAQPGCRAAARGEPGGGGTCSRGAAALLNPISWAEPFGMVMIEALASGTPVIAFGPGAAPEIVDHGRTGFLCARRGRHGRRRARGSGRSTGRPVARPPSGGSRSSAWRATTSACTCGSTARRHRQPRRSCRDRPTRGRRGGAGEPGRRAGRGHRRRGFQLLHQRSRRQHRAPAAEGRSSATCGCCRAGSCSSTAGRRSR